MSDPDLFEDTTKKALSAKNGRNVIGSGSFNRNEIHSSHDNKWKGAFTDREKKSHTHFASRNLGGSQRGLKSKKETYIFSHVNFI
jgi:hypothetical protein